MILNLFNFDAYRVSYSRGCRVIAYRSKMAAYYLDLCQAARVVPKGSKCVFCSNRRADGAAVTKGICLKILSLIIRLIKFQIFITPTTNKLKNTLGVEVDLYQTVAGFIRRIRAIEK